MKRLLKLFKQFLPLAILPISTYAQNGELTLSAQLRPRFELRNGTFEPLEIKDKPAALVSSRTRLTADYDWKQKLQMRFSLQNVNIWGQDPMVQNAGTPSSPMQFYEAWANLALSNHWNMKIGRQPISLDDERIFGALDWAQGARAHDAVSLNFKNKTFKLQSYFAYNQNYQKLYANNISNPIGNWYSVAQAFPYKSLQLLHADVSLSKSLKLSLLASNLTLQNANAKSDTPKTYNLQTMGGNVYFRNNKWKATGTGYVQLGENLKGEKVTAFLVAANILYQVNKQWALTVGNDFLSGRKNTDPLTENNSFQPTLGTNHKFYGSMDYYYSGNGHKDAGLNDAYLKANYTQNKWKAGIAFHQFLAPQEVIIAPNLSESNLGTELDADFNYSINDFTQLIIGYSLYNNTSAIDFLKNKSNTQSLQHWLFVSLNLNPNFFHHKN